MAGADGTRREAEAEGRRRGSGITWADAMEWSGGRVREESGGGGRGWGGSVTGERGWKSGKEADQINHQAAHNWTRCTRERVAARRKVTPVICN